jgi:glutaredoxin
MPCLLPQYCAAEAQTESVSEQGAVVYLFWGNGCPHCEKEKEYFKEIRSRYKSLSINDYEVWYNRKNSALMQKMAALYGLQPTGVPVTFIGDKAFVGFSDEMKEQLEAEIKKCSETACLNPMDLLNMQLKPSASSPVYGEVSRQSVQENKQTINIPLIGQIDASSASLPLLTIMIAGMDSFNPCAFFVLFSLLGLLIHAKSRKKMILIGGIFVFFSGFIYFLFMAAWLNVFLLMGQVALITLVAGVVSIIVASINIKDFFAYKQGVSLTIPDSAKPKLFDRMRKLLKTTSLLSIVFGTVVLAIAANAYELLCTAGFPMVFTRILTLNNLPVFSYYLYLVLYNLIYVIPLAIIVIIFTVTLGKRQLTEWQGRLLKLVSGVMMLELGTVLLFKPALLNNVFISLMMLVFAVAVSYLIAAITAKLKNIEQ